MCLPVAALAAMGASTTAGTGLMGMSMATTLSAAGTLASAGMSAIGAYQSVQGQKAQLQYQSQVDANNAKIAEWQANEAKNKGDEEAAKIRRQAEQVKGAQRTSMAARGLDLNEGTAQELQDQTDFFSMYDQNTVKRNASNEAWAARQQAGNFTSSSQAKAATAKSMSPLMSATTSLLGSAATVSDRWLNLGGTPMLKGT